MPARAQVAGWLQSDEEDGVTEGVNVVEGRQPDEAVGGDCCVRPRRKLRQQTLLQFVVPSDSSCHDIAELSNDEKKFQSIPWGDRLLPHDEMGQSTFRILSHNVNGLSTHNNNADVRSFAQAMQDKNVAVFGIQETNRHFGNVAVLQSFHSAIRCTSIHHQGAVSYAHLPWSSNYQPGGTAVSVRDKWATRFLAKGSDSFGRWSWLTLTGQGTARVTFISAYRVCDGVGESLPISRTVRAQQDRMYSFLGKGSVNLRKQFVIDLCRLIKSLQKDGHDIVLMMDANEASVTGSAVNQIQDDCGLIDAHDGTADNSPIPATHQRGSRKIDFVLVSPRVVESITGATILALQDGYSSDHRALVVDCDASVLFGCGTSDVMPPQRRRLTSTNPRAVHAYMDHMRSHIAMHRLVEKVNELQEASQSGSWTDLHVAAYEQIDSILDAGRRAAERKCKAKGGGRYPWSPELDKAANSLQYWKLRLWEFTSRSTNESMLTSLAEAAGISVDDQMWCHSKEVQARKRRARQELKAVRRKAAQFREQHNLEVAKFAATLHRTRETVAQAALAARERASRRFQQLRTMLKNSMSYGLDRIDVPNSFAVLNSGDTIPRIPLVTKEEIEAVLRPHTIKRFRQHQETPFGSGVRKTKLGLDCLSNDASAILDGRYCRDLHELSHEAQVWLQMLKRQDYVNSGSIISAGIGVDEWVAGWAKMRESTASAPGSHYGHYKTAAVAARLPEDHPDYNTDLASIYATMCSLPLLHGFAPRRWQGCVDAILEKIPGKPLIEKLRIIMLFEADFNFVLKCIWGKRLIRHAESNLSLGCSNHGCRPGRQTADALLEKLLIYETARLSRTSLITVDNDAKSCYDRIIKTLAMVACISYGLPLMAAVMHNRTMNGMEHRMKTRHGYFQPYQSSGDEELEGVGQGSGAAPAIWLIYSVTLLAAFQSFSSGIHIVSPFETLMVCVLAVFYVDDGMPGVNDGACQEATPLLELTHKAELAAQSWEKLLFASGGALELSKCYTYILYWDFTEGFPRLLCPDEIPGCNEDNQDFLGPIGVTYGNDTSTRHLLVTESPRVGRRTLGVRIAPAGTWTDELLYRQNEARTLARRFAGASISQETARLGYRSMVCPKLEYPLCITQFTQAECDSIMRPIRSACMSKMGYNRNMPLEVVYGPEALGGLGFHNLYIEQGIRQLQALVGHLRQGSETSKLMLIALEWCQVQAGTAFSLLEHPNIEITYIEQCWIMSLRGFLHTHKLKLWLSDNYKRNMTVQCDSDEFIMDALRERGQCSAPELQRLNACRMFLKIARLSDITCCRGRTLLKEVLSGKSSPLFVSQIKWPRQGCPPRSWWNLWNRKLRLVFSADGTSTLIRYPLGSWSSLIQPNEWRSLYDPVSKEVFVRVRDKYHAFATSETHGVRQYNIEHGCRHTAPVSLPRTALPATLGARRKTGSRTVRVRYSERTVEHSAPIDGFQAFVALQPAHIQQVMSACNLSDDTTYQLVRTLYSRRHISLGTDGGLLHGRGTFGFVLGDSEDDEILVTGFGNVQGTSSTMSSTRTELFAIFAGLTYLRLVIEYHYVVLPQDLECRCVCDSKSALCRMDQLTFIGFGTTWRCRANYDIEAAIGQCIANMHSVATKWCWVKGHASNRKPRHEFSWEESINDEADTLATAARDSLRPDNGKHGHWPEQVVSVTGPNGRMVGQLAQEVRVSCTAPDMLSYWQGRYRWSSRKTLLLETTGLKSALKGMSWHAQRRVQKLRCGWLPVNARESRMDPDRLPRCSACSPSGLVLETVDHIFQCESTARRSAIKARLGELPQWLLKHHTSRLVISALVSGATAWIEGNDPPDVDSLNLPKDRAGHLTRQAYLDQTELGWNAIFRGFPAKRWRLAQEAHFCDHPPPVFVSGETWVFRVLRWFFDLFELVWGLRNECEHGIDPDTQRTIRLARCERAIRRLYDAGRELPHCESYPFRDPLEMILERPLHDQELWIEQTEWFLPKAIKRVRSRRTTSQKAITEFFARRQA